MINPQLFQLICFYAFATVTVASAHPVARFGKIEVRAVWP